MILGARLWKSHFVGKSQLAGPCHWKFTECQFKVMWRSRSTTGQGEGDLNSWTIRGRSKNYMERVPFWKNEFQFFTHFFLFIFFNDNYIYRVGVGVHAKKIPWCTRPLSVGYFVTDSYCSLCWTNRVLQFWILCCFVELQVESSDVRVHGLSVCFVFLIKHCSDWLIVLNIKTSYRRVTRLSEVARY